MTDRLSFPIVAFIYIANKKLLVVRSKGKTVFYMPGGKVEKKESPVEAIIRECNEELSIRLISNTIEEYCFFTAPAYSEKNYVVDTWVYTGKFTGKIRPNSEIEEIRYVGKDEYCSYPEVAAVTKTVLEKLHQKKLIL